MQQNETGTSILVLVLAVVMDSIGGTGVSSIAVGSGDGCKRLERMLVVLVVVI